MTKLRKTGKIAFIQGGVIIKSYLTVFFICILSFSVSASPCEQVWADFSGLAVKQIALQKSIRDSHLHSSFRDPIAEQKLSTQWNKTPDNVPIAFSQLLPEDVHFIDHRLARSESPTSVKLKGIPGSPMVRVSYEYQGQTHHTNVIFSSKALLNNLYNQKGKRWLASPSAQAVILFLHGMGTQTAGAHVAKHIMSQFKNYKKVEILSLDLPYHGEGPRTFLSSLKEEVLALSAFAQKYIPPHVPLFVMAHSGGTVFAQKLISMTDSPEGSSFFHPNLKGVILFSPIADSAPNKGPLEKYRAFSDGQKEGIKKGSTFEDSHLLFSQHFESQNPVGELYGMWNITQWDARIPPHGGESYVPALMAVGTHDPLVFTGFAKDFFHGYYDKLSNMETHYLDKLPHLKNRRVEEVGHWLGEYKEPESGDPLQLALARAFIEKHIEEPLLTRKGQPPPPPLIQAMAMFSHDLAFRAFLSQYQDRVSAIARLNPELGQSLEQERKQLKDKVLSFIFHNPDWTPKHASKINKQINSLFFKKDSPDQALEFIRHLMKLPEKYLKAISQALKKSPYFDLKAISQGGMWLPSKKALLKQGLLNSRDELKMDSYLEELVQKIQAQFLLKQETKDLNNKKSKLIEKQKHAQEEVENAIFLIEQAIKLADKNPSSSLTESFKALSTKRDKALKARVDLIGTLEHTAALLVGNIQDKFSVPMSLVGDQSRTLPHHVWSIHQDREAIRAYQKERQNVHKQVIQAILQGEIGDIYQSQMYQKAGQDLYGIGFDIWENSPPYGALYLKLKTINQELAEIESALHTKTFLFDQGIQEYQAILLKLSSILKPYEGAGLDLLSTASTAYRLFNVQEAFMDFKLFLEAEDESAISHLLKNHEYVFQKALDIYQKHFHSDLLPPLPGIANDSL